MAKKINKIPQPQKEKNIKVTAAPKNNAAIMILIKFGISALLYIIFVAVNIHLFALLINKIEKKYVG